MCMYVFWDCRLVTSIFPGSAFLFIFFAHLSHTLTQLSPYTWENFSLIFFLSSFLQLYPHTHTHTLPRYVGDGVNDCAALRAADVGVSVDTGINLASFHFAVSL